MVDAAPSPGSDRQYLLETADQIDEAASSALPGLWTKACPRTTGTARPTPPRMCQEELTAEDAKHAERSRILCALGALR